MNDAVPLSALELSFEIFDAWLHRDYEWLFVTERLICRAHLQGLMPGLFRTKQLVVLPPPLKGERLPRANFP
jgi:hypothetical protein